MTESVRDDPVVRASMAGTLVFALAAILAAATAADPLVVAAVVIDVLLFVAGCATFVVTLVRAAGRSRTEAVTLSGIWWLAGSAPADVRRMLLGALAVQVVVALATSSARPFTGLAFGILVPTYGLGLVGLWAVRLGVFPPRV